MSIAQLKFQIAVLHLSSFIYLTAPNKTQRSKIFLGFKYFHSREEAGAEDVFY